jgi:hypothetical protein
VAMAQSKQILAGRFKRKCAASDRSRIVSEHRRNKP